MSIDIVDTGFDSVLAGEVYEHAPEPEPAVESDKTFCPDAPVPTETEITATVKLTPDGVQAAKALVHLPHMDFTTLARLARDMAMDIKERHVILKEFSLDNAQYDFLEANNEFYLSTLKAACKEWHAPMSTQDRIKVEAAAILEDSLLDLGARMRNKGEGLPGVIEAAKLFAKVAGVGERQDGSSTPGERITINIDLGGDQKMSVEAKTPALLAAAGPVDS